MKTLFGGEVGATEFDLSLDLFVPLPLPSRRLVPLRLRESTAPTSRKLDIDRETSRGNNHRVPTGLVAVLSTLQFNGRSCVRLTLAPGIDC